MKNRIFTNITGETRNTKIMKFTKNQKNKNTKNRKLMQNWKNKNTKIRNFMKVGKIKIQNENQEVYRKLEKNTKFTKNSKKIRTFLRNRGLQKKEDDCKTVKKSSPQKYDNQEIYEKLEKQNLQKLGNLPKNLKIMTFPKENVYYQNQLTTWLLACRILRW